MSSAPIPLTSDWVLGAVRAVIPTLKAPSPRDRTPRGACSYTHDTAFSPGGVYLNVSARTAAAPRFLALDRARTGGVVYVHVRSTRVPAAPAEPSAAPAPPAATAGVAPALASTSHVTVVEAPPTFDVVTDHTLVIFRAPPPALGDAVAAAAAAATGDAAADAAALSLAGECASGTFAAAAAAGVPSFALGVIDAFVATEASGAIADAAPAWEDKPNPSKYARALVQVPVGDTGAGRRVSPHAKDWRCDDCDRTENLWLNLSDGAIGCGRANFDGSGGAGHALKHFQSTRGAGGGVGYPLCVKLGTISSHGGDCYSYAPDEDDSVEDPLLGAHLAWFGINIMSQEKTEKTVAELSVDLNANFDWSRLTESGASLETVSGPGLLGLDNLGNTCYINATMQALTGVVEWAAPWADPSLTAALLAGAPREGGGGGVRDDMHSQTARLLCALRDPRYAHTPAALLRARSAPKPADASVSAMTDVDADIEAAPGGAAGYIVPRAFRDLVGKGHADFSTARQQDAHQFIGWLFDLQERAMARPPPKGLPMALPPALPSFFNFRIETRLQCLQTGGVRYSTTNDRFLTLRIPLEVAENAAEIAAATAARAAAVAASEADPAAAKRARLDAIKDGVDADGLPIVPRPRVSLSAALDAWASTGIIDDYLSPATGVRGSASRRSRLLTLPPYLLVVLGRYELTEKWSQKKIDADVRMPLELDLGSLAQSQGGLFAPPGGGLQPDEVALAGDGGGGAGGASLGGAAASGPPTPDAELVARMISMGFPDGAVQRAARAVPAPASDESVAEWLMSHMDDADFSAPWSPPADASAFAPDPASIAMLGDMGFPPNVATLALRECNGDLERATDWLFSHPDAAASAAPATAPAAGTGGAAAPPVAGAFEVPAMSTSGRFELSAIISHMGASTGTGHYVAHVRKDAEGRALGDAPDPSRLQWLLFNDGKVALSKEPPFEAGYIYLYRRCS